MSNPYSAFSPYIATKPSASSDILKDNEGIWWGSARGTGTYAGPVVSYENMMCSSTVFACSKAIAETIAGLPDTVYKRVDGRVTKEQNSDPAYLLTDEPNPEMEAFVFWELAALRLINRGNFFAEIQRDGADRPIALWPIHNSRVEPLRTPDGDLVYIIHSNWTGNADYADPEWRRHNMTMVSSRNMLNIVGFGSMNGVISPGVLPCANEVGMDFALMKYGSRFFSKGGSMTGVVEVDHFIEDDTQRAIFRRELNELHNNLENPHTIGVLWDGAKYKQINVNPEQAQFLETRGYTSRQICKFYGTPPGIIGDFEHSKYATADATIRQWVMVTLRNLAIRIEKAINRQVLKTTRDGARRENSFRSEYFYEMVLAGLLRGDPKTQAETNAILRQNGIITTNDWLEDLDKDPIDGEHGEYLIVPGGYTRLENIDNQGTRADAKGSSGQSTQSAQALPTFDREKAAEAISREFHTPKAQARGVDPNRLIVNASNTVAQEAINRVHSITVQQVSRWGSRTISQEERSTFWDKQSARLVDALQVCDTMLIEAGLEPVSERIAENVTKIYRESDSPEFVSLVVEELL